MEKSQILQESLKRLNDFARSELMLAPDKNLFELVGGSTQPETDNNKQNIDTVTIRLSNDTKTSAASGSTTVYTALIQSWAPQKDINTLISQMKSMPAGAILLADFVNPVMAEKFRRRSISFVDCAGNLSLKSSQFDFYVKRKKRPHLSAKRVRGRAFNGAGLKLIFAIFNRPELLHATYREISTTVNIALGSVGPVMDDLFNSGYILDDGQRHLVNKKRLFERWVDGYLEKLRPKQILASYIATNENWWKEASPETFSGVWGGDVVIAKSTPFIVPETFSLYFPGDNKHREFIQHYGLQKDDDGDICAYKSFWSSAAQGGDGISPMVMYADIVDSINPGNWDVAKTFYGEAVAELLKD
jgi:hypothetical protein